MAPEKPYTYIADGREYTNHTIPGTALIVTTQTPLPSRNLPPLPADFLVPFISGDEPRETGVCDAGHCYCDNPYRCGWHR